MMNNLNQNYNKDSNNLHITKDSLLKQIFASSSWEDRTKSRDILIQNLQDRYFNELQDFHIVNSLYDLKHNSKPGGYIRYFTYDGEIRYGGILLQIVLTKKNDIDDALIFIKNSKNETLKIHFNNYIIYYSKHKKRTSDMRNYFIGFLPKDFKDDELKI